MWGEKLVGKEKPWLFVLLAVVAWRTWCVVFLYAGLIALPEQKNFLGGGDKYFVDPAWWGWANFDGEHYLAIAQHGYGEFEQAFFPLYPYLIRWFGGVDWSNLTALLYSGLFISHISLILGLVWFYKLIRLDYDRKVAEWSVLALLAAPTSFFFGSVYTESLFLLLAVGCIYLARTKRWWLAGLVGGLASATRVIGVFLCVALAVEWLWQKQRERKGVSKWSWIPIGLSASGLVFYMRFLAARWGDALYFLHAQPYFGAERSVDRLILLYQVFWRYARMLLMVEWHSVAYYAVVLEAGTALLFLLLILLTAVKQRWSYSVFVVLAYIAPTLTGTFSSMPRYVLMMFPAFIFLGAGLARLGTLRKIYFLISGGLLGVTCALFTRGFFVS